ncbi:hypothetical protein BLOT_002181 [Blomia tropicalis]|nr:hypothetical protein BLOT_002181 [Blomia tropicalis]
MRLDALTIMYHPWFMVVIFMTIDLIDSINNNNNINTTTKSSTLSIDNWPTQNISNSKSDITLEPTSIAKLLNESFCQSNFACGIDSVCYKGVCRCNSGFKWNNYSYSCERIKCTNDRQCTKLFENTTCNIDTKTCQCLQSYELIRESQQCIMKIIPGHLTRTIIFVPISVVLLIVLIVGGGSGHCGSNNHSICYKGVCICDLGYKWNDTLFQCDIRPCELNITCQHWWPNTVLILFTWLRRQGPIKKDVTTKHTNSVLVSCNNKRKIQAI